jgi:hypothetical protein
MLENSACHSFKMPLKRDESRSCATTRPGLGGKVFVVDYDCQKSPRRSPLWSQCLAQHGRLLYIVNFSGMMDLHGSDWQRIRRPSLTRRQETRSVFTFPLGLQYLTNYHNHPIFELKAQHFAEAKKEVAKLLVGVLVSHDPLKWMIKMFDVKSEDLAQYLWMSLRGFLSSLKDFEPDPPALHQAS